jgi:hypothetical protein
VFKNPITLIADEPGTTDETKPPKIIITTNDAGELPEDYCITTFANLTIKNIAFSTTSIEGDYSWANAILLQADGLRIELENCYFELTGWGMVEAVVNNTVLILNRCHVRNGTVLPDGDEWCPFFIEMDSGNADSLIIRNSTFFNIQGSVINVEGQNPIKYFVFDHNTVVNIPKGFTTAIQAHLNSSITNNIFYNVGVHGVRKIDITSGSSDHVCDGIISVDTLASNEPGAPDSLTFILAEKDRIMNVKNNVYYFSQSVKDYFTEFADSIEAPLFFDSRTQSMFDDNVTWPNFVAENNVNADPGFMNFGGTDGLVAQMRNHRLNGTFGFWGWDPDSARTDLEPGQHWAFLQWPLPEDFSYTANFTSTDGYHVGSLVYYPGELALYQQNLSGVEDEKSLGIPQKFSLDQNYPNPFNPTTVISYKLPSTSNVTLKIYDVLGKEIQTLVNKTQQPGNYSINFNASKLSSGVYLYQLRAGDFVQSHKMILMK